MRKPALTVLLTASLFALIVALASQNANAQGVKEIVSFQRQIAPIFQASCIGCHNDKTPQGGISLVSYAKTMKGGKGGAQVIPNKSGESKLVKYLLGTAQPKMPIGGSLKPEQIDLIKRWIDQGARIDPTLPDTQAPPPMKMPMIAAPAPITSLLFSQDGKTLFVGAYKQVQFWNVEKRTQERLWEGHADAIRAMTQSKDGKLLLASGGTPGVGGEVQIWDFAAGKAQPPLNEHTDIINGIAITPDGKKLVTASADKSLRIWDMATRKVTNLMRDHADAVYGLAIRPDGKYLASCSADKSLKVWNIETAKRLYSISVHEDLVFNVSFSPDGAKILTASADSTARYWNFGIDNSGVERVHGLGGAGLTTAFSPDNRFYAASGANKTVRLYQRGNGGEIRSFTDSTDWVYSLSFSPDGKLLAAGTFNGSVLIWNTETGKLEATLSTLSAPAPKPPQKTK